MQKHEYPLKYPEMQRVVCAAIRASDGEVLIGIRHYSTDMHSQIRARPDGAKFYGECEQGFVDQWGNYLSRTEARVIAEKRSQIVRNHHLNGDELFSEHLY